MQRICASSYWKGGGSQEDSDDQAVFNQTGLSETTPEMPETPGTTSDMIQGISTTGRTTTTTPGQYTKQQRSGASGILQQIG
jgi:hypothetical protein